MNCVDISCVAKSVLPSLLTSISDWNRSKAPNAETSLSLDGRESFET